MTPEDAKLIGASDCPMLAGLSPWGGPPALYARIVHGVQPPQNEAQGAGLAAENYLRALYVQATGYELLGPQRWRHPMYPWMRCSPDDVAKPAGLRVLELKRYNYLDGWGPPGTDIIPHDIYLQVQMQCGVGLDCGYVDDDTVDVSALLRGEHRLYSVPHVPEVYERTVAMCERFWMDFIVPRRFPDGVRLELLERDVYALKALFPAPVVVEPLAWESLGAEEQELVLRWVAANRARKVWEKEEEALAPRVAMLLREVPGLEGVPGLKRVDFKATVPSQRLDVKGLRAEVLRMPEDQRREWLAVLEKHTKSESTRPLVAREEKGR